MSADRRDRFRALADHWRDDTGDLSVTGQILRHPAVSEILALGTEEPSLVFEYYAGDGHIVWSKILGRITGIMPDLPSGAADAVAPGWIGWDVYAVRAAWFRWGREYGYTQVVETDLVED